MYTPQKTLKLQLTGITSTETVLNKVVVDVTLDEKWFVLWHGTTYSLTVSGAIGKPMATTVMRGQPGAELGANARVIKETLRFADETGNIARLLRLLSLVQISRQIENPLEFRKLCSTPPQHIFGPTWFGGQGRSDLRSDPRLNSISF